jgi:hypothetical protein
MDKAGSDNDVLFAAIIWQQDYPGGHNRARTVAEATRIFRVDDMAGGGNPNLSAFSATTATQSLATPRFPGFLAILESSRVRTQNCPLSYEQEADILFDYHVRSSGIWVRWNL